MHSIHIEHVFHRCIHVRTKLAHMSVDCIVSVHRNLLYECSSILFYFLMKVCNKEHMLSLGLIHNLTKNVVKTILSIFNV